VEAHADYLFNFAIGQVRDAHNRRRPGPRDISGGGQSAKQFSAASPPRGPGWWEFCATTVGAYLSGGLDSAVIAALAMRVTGGPLRTFSIGFDSAEFDERAHQRQIARALGTEHRELRCSDQDISRVFPTSVWHAETPLLRTAPAPLYLLSQMVRDAGYKVVLTGEGADETLAAMTCSRKPRSVASGEASRITAARLTRETVIPLSEKTYTVSLRRMSRRSFTSGEPISPIHVFHIAHAGISRRA